MFRTGRALSGGWLRQACCKWGVALLTSGLVAGGAVVDSALARAPGPKADVAEVALTSLPVEAQVTHRLILAGGPFPYAKDGSAFGNRERLLPPRPRGDYREYTVKTPGARDRGARRIICSGRPPSRPDHCFYTDDHYASFRHIVP